MSQDNLLLFSLSLGDSNNLQIMDFSVFDIETDGLNSTKIHCLSVNKFTKGVSTLFTLTDYDSMKAFLLSEKIIVGHNIIRFDIPELERILNIKIEARLIDTLGLSWYLYPKRNLHGLESWGEDYGVPKPVVEDWVNLPLEVYVHRCEEDVKINTKMFLESIQYLKELYGSYGIDRIMDYITFKLQCAREQEAVKWKLDVKLCEETLVKLEEEEKKKYSALEAAIPPNPLFKKVTRPKVPFKKDGSVSAAGERWFKLLTDLGLPPEHDGEVRYQCGEEPGNPGAHAQMKRWLFSLGWQPKTFKFVKEEGKREPRKIPQLSNNDNTDLCGSVKALFEKEPALENLQGLFIVRHRIGLLKGFLRDKDENDFLKAEIAGFTNTMRFQHKTIVNLPTIHKPWGKEIRGCLIAKEGEELCGSDMSSLEDNTKQHYMFYFDPEFVKEMRVPGFDPHLDIALQGDMLTDEEVNFYKWKEGKSPIEKVSERYLQMSEDEQKKEHKRINGKRKESKQVNFSAVYGVGVPKMSLTTGWPQQKSKLMLDIYWKRNWAVKKIAESCTVKTVWDQMWLWNPVSNMWYTLRFEKDKFSTLNQGTGVYCFDRYVSQARRRGLVLCGQFHDEGIFPRPVGMREDTKRILNESIKAVNDELKLNIELSISMDFGNNYAEIH